MFKCKACPAHAEHIASLKDEVAALRKLLLPPPPMITEAARQADSMLGGAHEARIKEAPDSLTMDEIAQLEAARLFSGEYDGF